MPPNLLWFSKIEGYYSLSSGSSVIGWKIGDVLAPSSNSGTSVHVLMQPSSTHTQQNHSGKRKKEQGRSLKRFYDESESSKQYFCPHPLVKNSITQSQVNCSEEWEMWFSCVLRRKRKLVWQTYSIVYATKYLKKNPCLSLMAFPDLESTVLDWIYSWQYRVLGYLCNQKFTYNFWLPKLNYYNPSWLEALPIT